MKLNLNQRLYQTDSSVFLTMVQQSGSHDEQDDSSTPQVNGLTVASGANRQQHFRSQIRWRPTQSLHERVLPHKLGQAEVCHLYQRLLLVTGQQDIFRLRHVTEIRRKIPLSQSFIQAISRQNQDNKTGISFFCGGVMLL